MAEGEELLVVCFRRRGRLPSPSATQALPHQPPQRQSTPWNALGLATHWNGAGGDTACHAPHQPTTARPPPPSPPVTASPLPFAQGAARRTAPRPPPARRTGPTHIDLVAPTRDHLLPRRAAVAISLQAASVKSPPVSPSTLLQLGRPELAREQRLKVASSSFPLMSSRVVYAFVGSSRSLHTDSHDQTRTASRSSRWDITKDRAAPSSRPPSSTAPSSSSSRRTSPPRPSAGPRSSHASPPPPAYFEPPPSSSRAGPSAVLDAVPRDSSTTSIRRSRRSI